MLNDESNSSAWLQKYFEKAGLANEPKLPNLKDFVFLWMIFEGNLCGSEANIPKLKNIVSNLDNNNKLEIDKLRSIFNYFRDRYLEDGRTNSKFDGLKFRTRGGDIVAKELVKNTLEVDNPAEKDIADSLLIIVYRFRNNMFHGIKTLGKIVSQEENFHYLNKILIHFLTQSGDNWS